jgi:hypothetical protein
MEASASICDTKELGLIIESTKILIPDVCYDNVRHKHNMAVAQQG